MTDRQPPASAAPAPTPPPPSPRRRWGRRILWGLLGLLGLVLLTVGGVLVYLTSPGYMDALWTTDAGRIALVGCAVWMTTGVLVMRKMINFEI